MACTLPHNKKTTRHCICCGILIDASVTPNPDCCFRHHEYMDWAKHNYCPDCGTPLKPLKKFENKSRASPSI